MSRFLMFVIGQLAGESIIGEESCCVHVEALSRSLSPISGVGESESQSSRSSSSDRILENGSESYLSCCLRSVHYFFVS